MRSIEGSAPESTALPAREGAWRLRPGEAPVWLDLALDQAVIREWRRRADAVGIGVDAWIALRVELELVREHLFEVGVEVNAVADEARRSLEVTRLAPTPALRQWAAQLQGQPAEGKPPPDELPTIVLPERLIAQIPPGSIGEFVSAAAESESVTEVDATLIETAATAVGRTSETWAYLTALRRRGAVAS